MKNGPIQGSRGCGRGPVLLDISYVLEKDKGSSRPPLCTVSGYRIGNVVLTIAPNFVTNHLKSQKLMDSDTRVKISCYWLDSHDSVQEEHLGHVCHVWKVESVNNVISDLKKFNLKPFIAVGDGRLSLRSEVSFMLLKLGGNKYYDTKILMDALTQLSNYSKSQTLNHGQDVFTVYAPFGVNEFMNSRARGCLSNKFKEGLFLIDGRLAPGCEGAPMYTKSDITDKDFPIGIVLFPIAVGNDHSSYSLVAPVEYVIDAFLSSQTSSKLKTKPTWQSFSWNSTSLKEGVNNIIVVETPCSWGSGIVVSRGVVVTNAHVIGFNQESAVTLRWRNRSTTAKVPFISLKSSLLDIAVLQYNKAFGPPGIRISKHDPEVGERVLAVGNPLQISCGEPSLSKGVVLNYWKKSAGFSTSCIINAGSSGGAIVREDGTLLGLVVGICRSNKLAYPEINICISASILLEPLLSYQATGDLSGLQSLLNFDDTWLRAVMNFPKSKY